MRILKLNVFIVLTFNFSCYAYSRSEYSDGILRNYLIHALFGSKSVNRRDLDDSEEDDIQLNVHEPESNWNGRWLPEKHPEHVSTMKAKTEKPVYSAEKSIKVMKQMINPSCDDGKTNLTMDWAGNMMNYTCPNPRYRFLPDYDLPFILEKNPIPPEYKANHVCMDKKIEYSTDIPTFGPHRPAWARYGEYKFLPKQRWLHNLEHGAVVMLYHPCAQPMLVSQLKSTVKHCLYRHIITPYNLLPADRPYALITWGSALLMSAPDEETVVNFMKEHALRGPEQVAVDGQYDYLLTHPADIVTNEEDSDVCPQIDSVFTN